jgi:hypothetical protein
MRLAICVALGVAVMGLAYAALGPDITRYMKIRSM